MKSIILKGQEIKIGSKVRFVNNSDLYTFDKIGKISKPRLGRVYTVRGFTDKDGFFLEEIVNPVLDWHDASGRFSQKGEPGFAAWRFEPYTPLYENVKIDCEFEKVVEEKIEKPSKVTTPKKTQKELQLN